MNIQNDPYTIVMIVALNGDRSELLYKSVSEFIGFGNMTMPDIKSAIDTIKDVEPGYCGPNTFIFDNGLNHDECAKVLLGFYKLLLNGNILVFYYDEQFGERLRKSEILRSKNIEYYYIQGGINGSAVEINKIINARRC